MSDKPPRLNETSAANGLEQTKRSTSFIGGSEVTSFKPQTGEAFNIAGHEVGEVVVRQGLRTIAAEFFPRVLKAMLKGQEHVMRLTGREDKDRDVEVLNRVVAEYQLLARQAGVVDDSRRMFRDGSDYDNLQNQVWTVLREPMELFALVAPSVDGRYPPSVLKALGLPDTEQTSERVMTNYELHQRLLQLSQPEQLYMELKTARAGADASEHRQLYLQQAETFGDSIQRARLMGASLYPRFHWREFVRLLMSEGLSDRQKRAARFTADAGLVVTDNKASTVLSLVKDLGPTLQGILEEGILYDYVSYKPEKQTNQGIEVEMDVMPVAVPIAWTKEKGQLNLVSKPVVELVAGHTKSDKDNLSAKTNNKTVLIRYFDHSDTQLQPRSVVEFANMEQVVAEREVAQNSELPLVLNVHSCKGQIYLSLVADHMVTDGVPLSEIVQKLETRLRARYNAKDTQVSQMKLVGEEVTSKQAQWGKVLEILPSFDKSDKTPYREVSGVVPVEGIQQLREFLKQAMEKNTLIDSQGQPIRLDEAKIGTLISLLYGRMLNKLAHDRGMIKRLGSGSMGGLASHRDITEQLSQVSLAGLDLSSQVLKWFEQLPDGRWGVTDQVVQTFREAGVAFTTTGSARDSTDVVRTVHWLPKIFWSMNAKLSKTIFRPLASAQVGAVMVSSINSEILSGPAAVEEWQDVVCTFSGSRKGSRYMGMKMKTSATPAETVTLYKDLVSQVMIWEKRLLGLDGQSGQIAQLRQRLGLDRA